MDESASEPVNVHDWIRPRLERLATRRVVIPTVLAALLCVADFQWRDARLGGLELLDTRQWYTPEQAAAVIAGAAVDVFENLSIALLASTYDRAPTSWTTLAAAFMLLKSGLLGATSTATRRGEARCI